MTLQNGQGFIFKSIFHHCWKKYSDLQCSDYWKMHFVKLLHPWHDLIISLPIKLAPPPPQSQRPPPQRKAFSRKNVLSSHTLVGSP